MCGLVGIAGKIGAAHEKLFEQMLIVDTLRGQHSTGMAVVRNTGNVNVVKAVGNAFDLMDTRQYNGIYTGINRVLIGHNRYATTGGVNKRNAHPFDFDTLVGAHNGTLNTKWKLFENNKFQVDSEALYHHIEQKGLKDALDNLSGAWALTWYDKNTKTMNFLRNKERTLFLTTDKKGECVYWASEYWMLSGLLSRNGIEFDKIEMLPEDKHLSFVINLDTGVMDKPHVIDAPSTYAPPVYVPQQSYSPKPVTVPTNKPLALPPSDNKKNDNFIQIIGTVGLVETDRNGGKYLSVYADGHEKKDIRWYYPHDVNPLSWLGEEVEATMYLYRITDTKGTWHRISPSSVKLIEPVAVDEGPTKFVCNCMWCQTPIYQGEPYAVSRDSFFSDNDKLCKDCMTDSEISDYLTIVSTGVAE